MSDLVERLRDWHPEDEMQPVLRGQIREAADLIEQLLKENQAWQNQDLLEQCNRQAERIEELEDKIDRCGVKHPQDLKEAEAETPNTPSTDDQAPPQSTPYRAVGRGVRLDWLLSDFQEHKQQVERSLKTLKAEMDIVAQQSDSVRDRLLTLEARMSEAYQPREGLDPNASTPAFHGSEDRTPEPQLGDKVQDGRVYRRADPDQRFVGWFPERRSGKERRESKIEQTTSERHYVIEQKIYPTRRGNANRRKVDRGQGQ